MNTSHAKYAPTFASKCLLAIGAAWLIVGCTPDESRESAAVQEEAVVEVSTPDPLTVLIIDAPELGPQIKRQWRARRDGELTIQDVTASQWSDSDYSIEADVVLYPPGFLPDLVCGDHLLAVPGDVWNSEDVNRRDILKRARQGALEYDEQIWALPMASPQWMFLYRSDLLEQADVDVPKSWAEWTAAIEKLRAAEMSIAAEDRVIMPLAENWAAHAFLLRCAATIRQRGKLSSVFDRSNMQPLIDREPFVETLNDLKQSFGSQKEAFTPAQSWQRLLDGKCVMTIAWPMNLESDESAGESEVAELISVAAVPGSVKWFDLQADEWFERESVDDQSSVDYLGFGGLQGSVSGDTRHASTAFDFLQWLTSQSISSTVLNGSQQSGPFRKSQLRSIGRWSGSQLSPSASESVADLTRSAHNSSVALVFPRVPGYSAYLQSLDIEIRKCLAENSSASDALQAVTNDWEAITDRIGRTEQTANLRRGNGL